MKNISIKSILATTALSLILVFSGCGLLNRGNDEGTEVSVDDVAHDGEVAVVDEVEREDSDTPAVVDPEGEAEAAAEALEVEEEEDFGTSQAVEEDTGEGDYVNPNYDEKLDTESGSEARSATETKTTVDQSHMDDPEL